MSARVRSRFLESNHRLAGLGVTEVGAGKTFNGARIISQRLNRTAQCLASFLAGLDLHIEARKVLAHPLILANQWEIPDANSDNPKHEKEKNHQLGKLLPNSEVDTHDRIEARA